jgi:hypothetical protein
MTMMTKNAAPLHPETAKAHRGASSSATRALLTGGIVAGPIYVGVGVAEALLRPGFDLRRHELSLLANGDLGWIHVAMMVVTGLLTVAGALGLRRALTSGSGRTWGPLLVGLYGLGVAIAGLLTADPASAFPPGTPDGRAVILSWHGIGHLVAGSLGFLCLIVGCFVFTRRFQTEGRRRWAAYSAVTGIAFLAGFVGIASGSPSPTVNSAFGLAVVVAWAWVSALCAGERRANVRTIEQLK